MDVLFHSLFIWPIQTAIGFLYLLIGQMTDKHPAVTIVLLSMVVNVLILPLYLVADRWQKEEKDLLERMRPKLATIRAVFRGDERHMMVATYYRQMGYHPLLSLRSSIGLLMQIPFFLAAYTLLSHADGLKVGVWVVQDLSLPDRLFHVGDQYINVLPLVMTGVNLLSALVYGRDLKFRDNLPLLLMAGLFLVLLYDSPAGLVLYWTFNNLFSLGKNLVCRFRRPGRTFHGAVVAGAGAWGLWYALVVGKVSWAWGAWVAVTLVLLILAPRLWKGLVRFLGPEDPLREAREKGWMGASGAVLFLLAGVAVPLLFVASSPADIASPWAVVGRTAVQAVSLFLLLPAGLWALASAPVRRLLAWTLGTLALAALLFALAFPPTVTFNGSFTVNDPQNLVGAGLWGSTALGGVAALALVVLVVRFRKEGWATVTLGLGAASLGLVAVVMGLTLPPPPPASGPAVAASRVTPVFPLTRTGHNQFLLFIDGSPAAAFPEMLASVPGLKDTLQGFTWYANTVSYTPHTFQTVAPMMGGPHFTPEAINARKGVPLEQKHNDALRAMPLLMGSAGERVVLSDPWYISYRGDRENSLYEGVQGTRALNLHGVYSELYFKDHPLGRGDPGVLAFDNDILLRFSLFRMAPPAVRNLVYQEGGWWVPSTGNHMSDYVIAGYPNLVYLDQLCQVDDGPDTGNFLFSEVFHDTGAFDAQGRLHPGSVDVPAADLDRFGNVYSARTIYDGRAVFVQVEAWLRWLKDQGVYDNTRIMVVADHGHPLDPGPFGSHPWFRPLILFKDYDDREPLKVNEDLKTNADVPSFLTAGMPGAIPPRSEGDLPLVHDGNFWISSQEPDAYVFQKTWKLTQPDARVDSHWVEVNP